nr:hypothetical protein [Tanacetum cinerariifolium]
MKSNVGKRKRFVEDKEVEANVKGNESKADESEKENESEEDEKIKEDKESEVAEEVEADVKGNESEADERKEDNESEKSEESEEDKESGVAEELVKDVKTKVVKGGVVSKAKKRKDTSSMICKKVHEILGVPLGGTSIYDLPEVPLDDLFVKKWFKQFDPKPLKKIRACDIAKKLVLTKTVDFMFKVNFLMLFANVMGTADTMKAIVNLTLMYLDSTKFDQFLVIHQCPAIRNWTTTSMNRRQELEIQEQVIGKLDLHGEWTKSELDQTEGFYNVGENVALHLCLLLTKSMIEEKISMIIAEKIALEDLFKMANAEFLNDEKVIELCEKYRRLFKEYVFVKDFQSHTNDFDNNDDDAGGKNNDHGYDNVGKKKESAGKDVVNDKKDGVNAGKDGVNAKKDGLNVVQEGEADVNEEPKDVLEEEIFTQWIKTNIDWVGETKAIIEGTIDEEQQWKVFSDEISAQFKHDVSSVSLSEVDLSPSAMIILDNSNCGETYNSKYKVVCEPLVSMLRRMRFKIATKIFLHEFNVHAEKLFDLAFKFESENEKQRRILIIVNAIKNRDERDPAKMNTFVENQEDDAFKNK